MSTAQYASLHPLERWVQWFPAYQRRWIFERARFAVAVKSRQIGFSHATAAAAVFSGLFEKRPQLIISASQPLSDEVLAKAKAHCAVLAELGFSAATRFVVNNATEIAWASGGRIKALPANPRTARSFSGDVYLDEAAYLLDPEGIRDAVLPMVTRGNYRFRAPSTPNGAQGLFYDWVTSPPKDWKVHSVTVEDAIADGFRVDREELFHSVCNSDERLYGQWFGCQFLDADLQYYPTAMVEHARRWVGTVPDISDAEIYAGLDVGREHDLTALTVLAKVNDVLWTLKTITCKRTDFAEQKRLIRDARAIFRWDRLYVDCGGLGTQLAEELVTEFGKSEVKPYTFTNNSKHDLATRGLKWLRDGKVRFQRGEDGEALFQEAVAMRRKITASGAVVFEVPRTRAGHGDRLWSFLLALWGAGEPVAPRGMGQSPLLSVM